MIARRHPIARSSKPIPRTSRPARVRKTPLGRLLKKLDILFARYVKDRDGNVCITCKRSGLLAHDWNAGHFVPCGNMALRWDPKNCHSQCGWICNRGKRGAPREYAFAILERYGEAEFRRLMARKAIVRHWKRYELERLIEAIQKGGAEYELAYYATEL